MGFSLYLQGESSHAALLSRQDSELGLLETMRRVLIQRAKCDRDYGIALMQLSQTAVKMDQQDIVLQDSLLHKAWKVMLENLEEWSKLLRQNAETLVSDTTEKISHLITEKKASRRVYFEEHQRISNEVYKYQESVARTKSAYEQALEQYRNAKNKYEDITLKAKASRKQDDLKDRYQRASRKLHQAHNSYVLMLLEASDYEKDFRTVLLPGLLEYQQTVQEDMISKWCSILLEVCKVTDLTNSKFSHLQKSSQNSLEKVTAVSEYRPFIETYKSSPPEPIKIDFSKDLIGEGIGALQAGKLAVDSMTINSLRLKMGDLEHRMREVSAELKAKQTLLNQNDNEITNIQKNTQNKNSGSRYMSDIIRRELNELRCKESWLQHQYHIIHDPIASLGCEDSFNDNMTINGDGKQEVTKSKSSAIRDILKKPFSRSKSVTNNSPNSTPPTPTRLNESNNSADRRSNASIDITNDDSHDRKRNSYWSKGNKETGYDPDKSLEDENWFHGVLPREEVVRLLVNDGDYLVRETTRNDEQQIVLSVCWGGHKHFIVQTTPEGLFRFEGPSFDTIQELIVQQHTSNVPVTSKSGAILHTPILRELWELNNDDVMLLDKIGRGNFGDVYKARLANKRQEVAVKTCRVTLPDEQKKKFLQEGRILKQYDHPNIVKFIGICVQKQPIMIVMELVAGGSLLTYLRNHKKDMTTKKQLAMCLDTSSGMAYLESKNCIHRDLAARNCLVGEKEMVKISDFGMSREEEEYIVSDGMKQIPIKWTAPEALNFGKYTSLCDVWSFGVLCWEVFSGGEVPYQGYSNTKARQMIDSGFRMLSPSKCPDEMYQLMLQCWQYDPELRPHFDELLTVIQNL